MHIETLKNVLHWTKEFHQHLSQCLANGADKNTDERARMILDYLADHEQRLTKVINGFKISGDDPILNTWCYEYLNKQPIVQCVHCDTPFSELNAVQIMDVIVEQHQQVIELYRYLAARAVIPSVQEMMNSLKSLEEHEMKRMVQSANSLADI